MFKKCMAAVAMMTVALAAVACDKDGNEGASAPAEIAGIAAATQANALTAEQTEDFCGYLGEQLKLAQEDEAMKSAGCILGGVMMATLSGAEGEAATETCQSTFDECMARDMDEQGEIEPDICPAPEVMAGCDATLAELTTCMTGMLEWGFGTLRELGESNCEELTAEGGMEKVEAAMENMQALGDGVPDIEACAPVKEKCEAFFTPGT